jgi:GT2 family glycosyltransferase
MTSVSIVMPFLNAERYLGEAIASVERQTHQDWQLLLVDDGSTDSSAAIARAAVVATAGSACSRAAGVRSRRGSGTEPRTRARRRGPRRIPRCRRRLRTRRIETQVEALLRHPESMVVYGPTRWWHPGAEHRDWTEPMGTLAGRVHQPPTLLNKVVLLGRGHVPCTCSVMVRRTALDEVGGFEPFELYEDQTLWVKLFLRYPVYVSQYAGAWYRQHDDSVSARSQRRGEYDRTRPHTARTVFLHWTRGYVDESGVADDSIDRALRLAMAVNDRHWAGLSYVDRTILAAFATKDRCRWFGRRIIRIWRRGPAPGAERTSG